jgi:hypothetical protein
MVIACSPTGMPRNGVLRLDRRRQRGSALVCKVLCWRRTSRTGPVPQTRYSLSLVLEAANDARPCGGLLRAPRYLPGG